MKASELRKDVSFIKEISTGKTVLVKGLPCDEFIQYSYGLLEGGSDNTVYGESLESFEPVQLTEEWLLKFGFKITMDSIVEDFRWGNYTKSRQRIFEITALTDFRVKSLFIEERNHSHFNVDFDFVHNHFEYVHQLQNLYFVLTGHELSLNKEL